MVSLFQGSFHRNLSWICHVNSVTHFMPHWFPFWEFIFNFIITNKKHSFPMFDPNILMKITLTCQNRYFSFFIKTWTIRRHCSFLVVNLNGTKTLMVFIGQHARFCCTQKLKLLSLVINRPVRVVCVQNTSSSDVLGRPTWSPGHLK